MVYLLAPVGAPTIASLTIYTLDLSTLSTHLDAIHLFFWLNKRTYATWYDYPAGSAAQISSNLWKPYRVTRIAIITTGRDIGSSRVVISLFRRKKVPQYVPSRPSFRTGNWFISS
jgi:hypothetical protein